MLLNDRALRSLGDSFISPFCKRQVRRVEEEHYCIPSDYRSVISYGTSSYGYDARLANDFKVFTDVHCSTMDPKNPDPSAFVDRKAEGGKPFMIPPRGYVLGCTLEHFRMPSDVLGICVGKSTYARSGLIVNVTPLEPGWEGYVTLEFMNALPIPMLVYPHEGICQFVFFQGEPCDHSYSDRGGKYQGQTGVTLPRM